MGVTYGSVPPRRSTAFGGENLFHDRVKPVPTDHSPVARIPVIVRSASRRREPRPYLCQISHKPVATDFALHKAADTRVL